MQEKVVYLEPKRRLHADIDRLRRLIDYEERELAGYRQRQASLCPQDGSAFQAFIDTSVQVLKSNREELARLLEADSAIPAH